MRRQASRRDGNHKAIADCFEQLGCYVLHFQNTGIPGLPDLGVGCMGVTHLCEIKDRSTAYGRSGLNHNQSAFARDWRGSPVHEVSTVEEATSLVQKWRRLGTCVTR